MNKPLLSRHFKIVLRLVIEYPVEITHFAATDFATLATATTIRKPCHALGVAMVAWLVHLNSSKTFQPFCKELIQARYTEYGAQAYEYAELLCATYEQEIANWIEQHQAKKGGRNNKGGHSRGSGAGLAYKSGTVTLFGVAIGTVKRIEKGVYLIALYGEGVRGAETVVGTQRRAVLRLGWLHKQKIN